MLKRKFIWELQTMGAFHLRRLAGNVAGKLGNAYLRYQNRQPSTCFPLAATVAMLAVPVLQLKWKAPYVLRTSFMLIKNIYLYIFINLEILDYLSY